MDFEIAVAGGSFAGLSAALQAARARRTVLVVDAGLRRNRFAAHSHGFLGQDGRAPADIVAQGKAQLLKYPTVTWIDGRVDTVTGEADAFTLTAGESGTHTARRLVIATGVVDTLPDIPGLSERWGKSVFMCPYCDGYELGGGEIAVLATSEAAMHQTMILPHWGPTTLFTNDAFAPNADQREKLRTQGIRVITEPVTAISGERATVNLADGQALDFVGLFTAPKIRPASDLGEQLGLETEEGPMGPVIKTDMMKKTSLPGVYAAGDTANMAASVAFAVRDGAVAGAAAQQSLIFGA